MKKFLIKYINALLLYLRILFVIVVLVSRALFYAMYTSLKIGYVELIIFGIFLLLVPPLFILDKSKDYFERWW